MITLLYCLLLLLSISSLCAFSAVHWKRRFEEMLPLACIMLSLICFVFGIIGKLFLGFYAAALVCAFLWIATVVYIFVNKKLSDFTQNFFTPAAAVFCVLYAFLFYINYGKQLASWDEFSHWGDVVKMMTNLGVLSYSPISHSAFPEYPPMMSLLQFYAARMNMLVLNQPEAAEWTFYFAYQIFMLSFYFPFLKNADLRSTLLLITIAFFLPTLFQDVAYARIYIDSFLSTVFGVTLFTAVKTEFRDRFDYIKITLFLLCLSMTKNTGILFAVFCIAAFAVNEYCENKTVWLKHTVEVTLLSFSAQIIWQLAVKMSGANAAFKIGAIVRSPDEKVTIIKNYISALSVRNIAVEGAIIPFFTPLISVVIFGALLHFLLKKFLELQNRRKCFKPQFVVITISAVMFIISLCVSYIFMFNDADAFILDGFERYINNFTMAAGVCCLCAAFELKKKSAIDLKKCLAVLLVLVALLCPIKDDIRLVMRKQVSDSILVRAPFDELAANVKYSPFAADKIVLINFDGEIFDSRVMQTILRPCTVYINPQLDADNGVTDLMRQGYDHIVFLTAPEDWCEQFYEETGELPEQGAVFAFDSENELFIRTH